MVSLKPFLDPTDDKIAALVESYQRLLHTTAACNADLCVQSAGDLSASLKLLEQSISTHSRPSEIVATQSAAERHLFSWHDRTQDYLRQKAAEMKEVMMLVAQTAENLGERDKRHNQKLRGLTTQLRDIAELEDISRVRTALIASVAEISRTVEQMARETEQTRRALEVELSNYRNKLEKSEQDAMIDPLTGVGNRRCVENDIHARMRRKAPFALVLLDLNGFKHINDTYGHNAGDQILRQFAAELRQVCTQTDMVGRWGGDEFVVVTTGEQAHVEKLLRRIEQWVWGTYPIKLDRDAPSVKVEVRAALGYGLWVPGMELTDLVHAADSRMYSHKTRPKSA